MVEWIEINRCTVMLRGWLVSTLVVEWIEICYQELFLIPSTSPPSWWSGLKFTQIMKMNIGNQVSTLVVEWIEI